MARPKAPVWLRESFRDGVDERAEMWNSTIVCWLAHHDPRRRSCSGPLERFHFIPRQRVENAMWEALRHMMLTPEEIAAAVLQAAWDPRNGGVACEAHHRRFDKHIGPELTVPFLSLPHHLLEFALDYGFLDAGWFEERFPG